MQTFDFSRLWFVTFADSRLKCHLNRIKREAIRFGLKPSNIHAYDETCLDNDFREEFKDHLIFGSRGFGYWCWKPQVILQAFRDMPDGDILLYTDVGCTLNYKGAARFFDYVAIAREQNILGFQSKFIDSKTGKCVMHTLPEREWTKGDILDFFNVRHRPDITETGQIGATIILAKKCSSTYDFFAKFKSIFLTHFNLCDDSPSISPNMPGFKENRHDQSIFSILYKIAGYTSLMSSEYTCPWVKFDKNHAGHVALGRDFFANSKLRPFYSTRKKDIGWKRLIPLSLKPKYWKLVNWMKSKFF